MTRSLLPFAAILACCLTACSAPAPQGEATGGDAAGDRDTPAAPSSGSNDGRGVSARPGQMIDDPIPTPDPVSATTPTADVPDSAGTCDGGKVSSMVGEVASAAVVQRAVAGSGARTARVIKPGMAVTMDYRFDRLNVHVDAKNVITQLACG